MPRSLLALFLFSLLLIDPLSAQRRDRPVFIEVERNSQQEPVFYSVNRTNTPYTIELNFTDIRGAVPVTPNPYPITAEPGRRRVFQLKKFGLGDGGIRYRYKYSISKGCHDTEPDEDVEYLIPLAEGKTTRPFELTFIGEMVEQDGPEGYYFVGFRATRGDTVYASRSGTVTGITNEYDDAELDQYYTSKSNSLEIVHEDCTFAVYKMIKKDGFLVGPGDKVTAGDPIGVITSNPNPDREHVRMSVYYRQPDPKVRAKQNSYWKYLTPKFRTTERKHAHLTVNKEYIVTHPAEVITQEMSRRERRRWRRSNN